MSALVRRVDRAIREEGLWAADDRVAVAVSGGADSVALSLLLARLAPQAAWRLAGLIHVNHGLRGQQADADADFCARLAARLDLPYELVLVDVPAALAVGRRSLEATARTLRYRAIDAAADRLAASVIATAHTADDQAETVLLRLLRGATARGVSAIRPRRGRVVRPLLSFRRAELRGWLDAEGERWVEDASNADETVPRNRLRRSLFPVIERDWPGAVRALARFAESAAIDERWLSRKAAEAGRDVTRIGADGVELTRAGLAGLPPPVGLRVLRDAIEAAGGTPTHRDVKRLWRLCRSGAERTGVDLHDLRVDCTPATLFVGAPTPARPIRPFGYRLDVPGEVTIRETGGVVRASLHSVPARVTRPSEGWDAVAAVPAAAIVAPLVVRSRLPGDRLFPLGAPGSKRLQDLLVDRKIPRSQRDSVPIVVNGDGTILWVAGVATSESGRVREPETGMVILEFKKGSL